MLSLFQILDSADVGQNERYRERLFLAMHPTATKAREHIRFGLGRCGGPGEWHLWSAEPNYEYFLHLLQHYKKFTVYCNDQKDLEPFKEKLQEQYPVSLQFKWFPKRHIGNTYGQMLNYFRLEVEVD